MTEKEIVTIDKFGKFITKGNASNEFLVQIIEVAGMFLNIQTISNHAKENNISYNGAKKYRNNVEIFGVKFIIDN